MLATEDGTLSISFKVTPWMYDSRLTKYSVSCDGDLNKFNFSKDALGSRIQPRLESLGAKHVEARPHVLSSISFALEVGASLDPYYTVIAEEVRELGDYS